MLFDTSRPLGECLLEHALVTGLALRFCLWKKRRLANASPWRQERGRYVFWWAVPLCACSGYALLPVVGSRAAPFMTMDALAGLALGWFLGNLHWLAVLFIRRERRTWSDTYD